MNDLSDEETLDNDIKPISMPNSCRAFRPDGVMKRFMAKVTEISKGEFLKEDKNYNIREQNDKKQINIFISYCWQSRKEAVHEMARHLMEQPDFKVWIDMDSMSGYTYESMAKGLDEADIVIVFFSQEYADSPNCRREIEYAANKNKEILPIRVEKGYRPDGWLLFIFKSQLRFDFCEDDNFHETAVKICEHIRSCQSISGIIKRETRSNQAKSSSNFRSVGAPFFSKSKYFSRPEDEQRILEQIKNVAENPDDGCLIVSGDGGVGKTTLVARLLTDEKNYPFFVQESNFHRAIWINCFDWREVFDEKAFVDKIVTLAKELEDSDRSANFFNLQGIASYFKRKNLRLAYILDDMFNYRLIQSFLEKLTDPPICFVVTRDAQSIIETNFGMVQKVERVEELTDEGIKEMLKSTFKLNKFLMDDQLYKLAALCCGLPLIASLIAARISNCEDKVEARSEYKLLTSPQYRISELKPQNKSFKTVSSLFTFSIDQMDASLRKLYYAFLFFNPAEPVSIFDLGVFWGFDLDENSRCGLRGICRAFEKRSLVRRVKKNVREEVEEDEKLGDDLFDDASEDRFLLHQMLYEAALEKATKDNGLSNIPDDKCLDWIRFQLVSGEMGQADGDDGLNDGLGVIVSAVKYQRRNLLYRIIDKLNGEILADFCIKKSSRTNGMPFLQFVYNFQWRRKEIKLSDDAFKFNPPYRIVKRVFSKIVKSGGYDLLWKVVSERQTGTRSSLALDIMEGSQIYTYMLDKLPLLTQITKWSSQYAEMKWEKKFFGQKEIPAILLAAYDGDSEKVSSLLETSDISSDLLDEAVIAAARRGFLDTLSILLEKNPSGVGAIDDEGCSPISIAAKNGYFDVVRYLYYLRPDIIWKGDSKKRNAAMWASRSGNIECLKFFIEKEPEIVKALDHQGDSLVVAAAADGRLEVIKYLYETFPEMSKANKTSPLLIAGCSGRLEVVKYLYDKCEQKDIVQALGGAATAGQLEVLKYLIEMNPGTAKLIDPDLTSPAICLAASTGQLECVEALIDISDAIVEIDHNKITLLHFAASGGHLDIVQLVHQKHPELINMSDQTNETPLSIATQLGHKDVVQFLLDNGAE